VRSRGLLFTGLAIVACIGTGYLARAWLSNERAQASVHPTIHNLYVLVAAKDLPTGNFVRAEDLQWQVWPDSQINDNYLRKDKDTLQSLVGSVVRQPITAGEPVMNRRLIKPGDRGFLAAVLGPGMRAVSVSVTATSEVAGLVFPGDRVDLVLSHQIKDDRNPNAPAKIASETILTNIRVLAVDQTIVNPDNKPLLAKTITFEVTPKQVEVIGVAEDLGNLSLSLRALASNDDRGDMLIEQIGSVSHTWDNEVSSLIVHHETRAAPVITVLRGSTGTVQGQVQVQVQVQEKIRMVLAL
jgi:pilus assembly protein CpaB